MCLHVCLAGMSCAKRMACLACDKWNARQAWPVMHEAYGLQGMSCMVRMACRACHAWYEWHAWRVMHGTHGKHGIVIQGTHGMHAAMGSIQCHALPRDTSLHSFPLVRAWGRYDHRTHVIAPGSETRARNTKFGYCVGSTPSCSDVTWGRPQ